MPQIEIDFQVFKELTNRRASEEVTYNDVVRALLKLPRSSKSEKSVANAAQPWVVSDTSFPAGTDFRAEYRGTTYSGQVKDGKLELDGHKFSTPSAAAVHVKGHQANGWRFWKCRLPGTSQYVPIERLRGKAY